MSWSSGQDVCFALEASGFKSRSRWPAVIIQVLRSFSQSIQANSVIRGKLTWGKHNFLMHYSVIFLHVLMLGAKTSCWNPKHLWFLSLFNFHLHPEQYSILIYCCFRRRFLSPNLSIFYTGQSNFQSSIETWWEGGIVLLLLHNRYKASSWVFSNGLQFIFVITLPVPWSCGWLP